jgi:hypothetical protein
MVVLDRGGWIVTAMTAVQELLKLYELQCDEICVGPGPRSPMRRNSFELVMGETPSLRLPRLPRLTITYDWFRVGRAKNVYGRSIQIFRHRRETTKEAVRRIRNEHFRGGTPSPLEPEEFTAVDFQMIAQPSCAAVAKPIEEVYDIAEFLKAATAP